MPVSRRNALLAYAITFVCCMGFLIWTLQLWKADLRVPTATADGTFGWMVVKTIQETGWYYHNPHVGGVSGLALPDFPAVDAFNGLLLKTTVFFVPDPGMALNVLFLISFPLTALITLYVLRKFDLTYPVSMAGALLYSFTPFHWMRGEGHLFYSLYFLLPLMVMVILWVGRESRPFLAWRSASGQEITNLRQPFYLSLGVCLLIGLSTAYYAFFGAILMLTVGAATTWNQRSRVPLQNALLLTCVIGSAMLTNIAPTMLYWRMHGKNPVAHRGIHEAELYGLKIAQLVLPIPGHRVALLAMIRSKYDGSMPLVNENTFSSLGLAASMGFAALIGILLARRKTYSPLMDLLATLTLSALLLSTVGGACSLLALMRFTQIRAYNRISIYIAFFAIMTLAVMADQLYRRMRSNPRTNRLFWSIFVLVVLVGLLDETPARSPEYAKLTRGYESDARFAKTLEHALPANVLVWQLPYVPFPESAPVNKMLDYQHFRPYLHTTRLRWSYGAMKGREEDSKQAEIAALPLPQMLDALVKQGYCGIYLDRDGYADAGKEVEAGFAHLLGARPLISEDNKLMFFSLQNYIASHAIREEKKEKNIWGK